MDLKINWQDKDDMWKDFDIGSILHLSVRHSCNLFSNSSIPVIARQDGCYIVNTDDLKARYLKTGKFVTTFQTILEIGSAGIDRPLCERGFVRMVG